MYKKYFTREEFMNLRVRELPNITHNRIMDRITNAMSGFSISDRIKERFENIPVYQIGEYVKLEGIIEII